MSVEQSQPQRPSQEPSPRRSNSFLRYSGMATQMAATIGLAVWGGIQLDRITENKHHLWTLILSITGVVLAMYMVIKDLLKK